MRVAIGLMVLGLVAASASAATILPNTLLVDPGFEGMPGSGAWLTTGTAPAWGDAVHTASPQYHDGGSINAARDTGYGTYNNQAYQTVALPGGPGDSWQFEGYAHAGPQGVFNRSIINIRDGGVAGPILYSQTVTGPAAPGSADPTNPTSNWTQVAAAGISASGSVTVEFILEGQASWDSGAAASRVDDFALTPEPASLALFALVGLPLLRRRR